MSYSKFSETTAQHISKELKFDEEQRQIIAYSIENIMLTALGFILILLAGAIFGAALPSGIAAVFGGLLRRLSGGAHFDTPVKCLAFGTIVYGFIGFLSKYSSLFIKSNFTYILFLCISLLLVLCYSPVDSNAKPIKSPILRKKLKIFSIIFVSISIIITMFLNGSTIKTSIVFGLFYQALTLLPFLNNKEALE